MAVICKIIQKHKEEQPDDNRSPEETASELWQMLNQKVKEKDWQSVYDEVLGGDRHFAGEFSLRDS